jgi:predicted acyltransferase
MRGLTVAAMLIVNDAGDWDHVHPWLEHSQWNGCTPADYIFPFFLFIVGVSIGPSLDAQLTRGEPTRVVARKIAWRGLRIVLLGLALAVLAWMLIPGARAYRPMGVLQRIGVCYTAGGLLALYLRDPRIQWGLFAAILLGYWLLLWSSGPLLPGLNLADRIDSAVLGSHAYLYDAVTRQGRDPEGLLSTLPAIATVILGIRVASWLRAGGTLALVWGGAASLVLGAVWATQFPINKQLWTSSFVLWTGGAGMLLLAIAHHAFDVWQWPPVGRSLGVNAISAYAGSWIAICLLEGSGLMRPLYRAAFANTLGSPLPAWVPSLAFALAFTGVFWILVSLLTRRGWRLTI